VGERNGRLQVCFSAGQSEPLLFLAFLLILVNSLCPWLFARVPSAFLASKLASGQVGAKKTHQIKQNKPKSQNSPVGAKPTVFGLVL